MMKKELFALVSPCLQLLAPLQPNSKTVAVHAGVPYIDLGSGLFGIWIKTYYCSSVSRRVVVSLLCAMHVTESILIPVHPTAPCTYILR